MAGHGDVSTSYWAAGNELSRPPQDRDTSCDVCVLGVGRVVGRRISNEGTHSDNFRIRECDASESPRGRPNIHAPKRRLRHSHRPQHVAPQRNCMSHPELVIAISPRPFNLSA